MIPMCKKENSRPMDSYRLISILPSFSKIFFLLSYFDLLSIFVEESNMLNKITDRHFPNHQKHRGND